MPPKQKPLPLEPAGQSYFAAHVVHRAQDNGALTTTRGNPLYSPRHNAASSSGEASSGGTFDDSGDLAPRTDTQAGARASLLVPTGNGASQSADLVVSHPHGCGARTKLVLAIIGHVIVDSLLTSCAWAIAVDIVLKRTMLLASMDLTARLLALTVPVAVFFVAGFVMQYNLIARRSDGQQDAALAGNRSSARRSTHAQSAWRIPMMIFTWMAIATEALDGMLAGLAFEPSLDFQEKLGSVIIALTLAAILGAGKLLSFIFVDAQAAWRKYVEYSNFSVLPLAMQNTLRFLFRHASKPAHILRELFAPLMGALHALCIFQIAEEFLLPLFSTLSPIMQKLTVFGIILPLIIPVFVGSALINHGFDVQQMIQALKDGTLGQVNVNPHGVLTRMTNNFLRFIGMFLNGTLLYAMFRKCGIPEQKAATAAAWTGAVCNAIGLMALTYRGLTEYIVSSSAAQLAAGEEGILLASILGVPTAWAIGNAYYVATVTKWALGALLGVMQSYAKISTVKAYLTPTTAADGTTNSATAASDASDTFERREMRTGCTRPRCCLFGRVAVPPTTGANTTTPNPLYTATRT